MIKKLITPTILALTAYFIVKNINSGIAVADVLLEAKPQFLLLVFLTQAFYLYVYVMLYKQAFDFYNVKWSVKEVILLELSATYISLVAPFGTISRASIFLHKAKKDGFRVFGVTAGLLLATSLYFLALFAFLTLSMIFLYVERNLLSYELIAYLLFSVIVLAIIAILSSGLLSEKIYFKLFDYFQFAINKLNFFAKHKQLFADNWVHLNGELFIKKLRELHTKRKLIREFVLLAIAVHIIQLFTLYFTFMAFGVSLSPAEILVGYSIGTLFITISPTPQGIGFVEVVLPASLQSLNVDISTATLATLAYRAITLWIPAIIGFWLTHKDATKGIIAKVVKGV